MNGEISETLSDYVLQASFGALTPTDQAHMVDASANRVGCAYGGARHASVNAAAQGWRDMSPNGKHTDFGRTENFNLVDAVSLDCLSSAVQAYDDTHLETVLHPTGPVAAAALGIARQQKVSGLDYLTALHVGMEVECRVGLVFASAGSGAKSGWYSTGIACGVGAAVAAGRLLGFDKGQLKSAMGLAAARASGTRGTHGSPTAAYVPSIAAESGLIAAMLTRSGLACGSRALDGDSGLLELITEVPQVERALRGLGSDSEAARTALRNAHGVTAANFEHLTIRVSPKAFRLVATTLPRTETQAQVSLYYWAAVTLEFGRAGVSELSQAYIDDPHLQALQERMTAVIDETLADDQCVAQARLRDGRVIEVLSSMPWLRRPADEQRRYRSEVHVARRSGLVGAGGGRAAGSVRRRSRAR